jgi:hypothetical protein
MRCLIPAPRHNAAPTGGSAATMLIFATGLLVAGPMARAADDAARPPSIVETGAHRVRVQPRAKEFAPPFRPDVSVSGARTVDALYRQLIAPQPAISQGSQLEARGFLQAMTPTRKLSPTRPNRLNQIPPAGSAANPPPDKRSIATFHGG